MTELEDLLMGIMILCFAVICYTAGIVLMIQEKTEEIRKSLEQQEGDDSDG